MRRPVLLHDFFTVSLLGVLFRGVRWLVHYLHCLLDEVRDELLYQEMALLLLFSGLLPIAVAPLTVPSAGLARRAICVALPCTSQLVSLVSIATLSFVYACDFLVCLGLLLLASGARL